MDGDSEIFSPINTAGSTELLIYMIMQQNQLFHPKNCRIIQYHQLGWMNFSARIKKPRKQPIASVNPKYVLNLNIEIPINSKYAFTSRPPSHQSSPQSNNNKPKNKFQLSITPARQKTRSQSLQPCGSRPVSKHKKGATISFQLKSNKIQKYKSIDLVERKRKKHASKPSSVVRGISVLDYVENDESDNIIRYTNKTVQQANQKQDPRIKLVSSASDFNLVNVQQMREYEGLATERKQHLNYEYLKNIQMQVSAKKIQRAWRNYITKKLIKSYSSSIPKAKSALPNPLKQSPSQNNKDLFWKKKKRPLNTLTRCLQKQNLQNPNQIQQQHISNGLGRLRILELEQKLQQKQQTRDTTAKLHEFQTDETDRFDKFYQRIRQQRDKIELNQQERIPYQIIEKQKSSESSSDNRNTPISNSKSEEEQVSSDVIEEMEVEKRKEKIAFFEKEIKQIDNEISSISDSSVTLSPQQTKFLEQLQSKKLRKKLNLFSQMQILKFQNQQQNRLDQDSSQGAGEQPSDRSSSIAKQLYRDMEEIIKLKQKKLEEDRGISYGQRRQQNLRKPQIPTKKKEQTVVKEEKQFIRLIPIAEANKEPIVNPFSPKEADEAAIDLPKRLDKLPVMSQLELCKKLVEQLIMETLLDFSESEIAILKLKQSIAKPKQQQSHRQQKPQGICTNLDSIKEYLQNLVTYVLDNHRQTVVQKVNVQAGPTPTVLFQYLRKVEVEEYEGNSTVIPLSIFDKHWQMASEQIYFDQRHDDQKLQAERIRYLKGLTKVYFRSIFDAFNQSLEFNRLYGYLGKPYPWKTSQKHEKKPVQIKSAMRYSYKRLSTLATVYCGLHFEDKRHNLSPDVIKEVQDQRLNNLLTMQLEEEEQKWSFYDDQEAQVLYEITLLIEEEILNEALRAIKLSSEAQK